MRVGNADFKKHQAKARDGRHIYQRFAEHDENDGQNQQAGRDATQPARQMFVSALRRVTR